MPKYNIAKNPRIFICSRKRIQQTKTNNEIPLIKLKIDKTRLFLEINGKNAVLMKQIVRIINVLEVGMQKTCKNKFPIIAINSKIKFNITSRFEFEKYLTNLLIIYVRFSQLLTLLAKCYCNILEHSNIPADNPQTCILKNANYGLIFIKS